MAEKKTSWADIASIENLSVDWSYKPENPLGKRQWVRMNKLELKKQLEVNSLPLKVATSDWTGDAALMDLGQSGVAINPGKNMARGTKVKLGMLLGTQKIVSSGVVRNLSPSDKGTRVGIEFVDLPKESEKFISSLVSAKNYRR